MRELTLQEFEIVSGGEGGTLREPITNPQSELGNSINDVARGINDFGSWLGIAVYELIH
ncbi:hypothetical protein LUX29_07470 [Aureimonas altamirensis]|uniref:hypothetical protein n=1 Tax=Aureimonas altamirensis TaxID=370622 RepID=UPI001E5ADA24|nr:hypothetical protein [Aureimonas altamirensis]UHD47024.1 hypothetical protein LUX29_07470 [Aureimonas altamirensis]